MGITNWKERHDMNKKISNLAPEKSRPQQLRKGREVETSKIKWRNLPAIDIVTKTLVYDTPCDETFEKRLSNAAEKLCYTKSEIVAIRNRRDAFIKAYWRTQGVENIKL